MFSSTGSEQSSMPTISPDSSSTVTYTNATLTSSTGSFTMTGDAASVVIGVTVASAPTFSKSVTVAASTDPVPTFSSVGTVTANNTYSPAGLVMNSSGNTLTVPVTISALGSGTKALTKIKLFASESAGRSSLVFATSGSSGTGAGGTWTASASGSGFVTFDAPGGVTSGTVTFTVAMSSVPSLVYDGTDSISAAYVATDGTTGGTTFASNTLKRYSFEVTGVSPPASAAQPSVTLSPVLSVANRTTESRTLTAASTSIGGTAFSATGTEGSMPAIAAGGTGTVTYTNATTTSSNGTRTVTGTAATTNFSHFDGSNFITVSATSPTFSKNVTIDPSAVDETLPAFSAVGAATANNTYSPAGFIMDTSGNTITVPVTISQLGTGNKRLSKITITAAETGSGGTAPSFQTSGSSGTGAGGTWNASSAGSGQITFDAPGGLTTGTATFTISVASVPRLNGDGDDTLTATYVTTDSTSGGATVAANTLKRYAFEISSLQPPITAGGTGTSVSPVMTIVNHTLVSRTLSASNTSLSGNAFSATGTEGSMPTITAGASATVTYTSATITTSTGSRTVEGDALSTATLIGLTPIATASAPHFSKSITVSVGGVDDTLPSFAAVGVATPNNSFPTAGFIMDTSGNNLTIPLTISSVGSGTKALDKVRLTTSELGGGSPLSFQTSGSSGSGAGGTWTASSVAAGQITFDAPSGATAGTVIFTVSVASVPRLNADGSDSFSMLFISDDASTGGTTSGTNSLKRYSLEVTGVSPPGTAARPSTTINPVLTVLNHSLVSATLNSTLTGIGGAALSSMGSEGSMPAIGAGASGTVPYTGAVTTATTGTATVTGDAAGGSSVTAPQFSKSVTIDGTAPVVTVTAPTTATAVKGTGNVDIAWSSTEAGTFSLRAGGTDCTSGTEVATGSYTSGSTTTTVAAANLAEGANTIRVCLSDAAGNSGSAITPIITKDSVVPDTKSLDGSVQGSTASFSFTSSDSQPLFECSLDGGAYIACTAPKSYSGLSSGSHTFGVRAVDAVGNVDPTPVTTSFRVSTSSNTEAEVVWKEVIAASTASTEDENDGATPLDPLEVTVTSPLSGIVTIEETPTTRTQPSWTLLLQQANITAPIASSSVPLTIVMRLDASMIPAGTQLSELATFKNSHQLAPCSSTADTSATPDPCLVDARFLSDGDYEVTARASSASAWTVGVSRVGGDGSLPEPPQFLGTVPSSPGDSMSPNIVGLAEPEALITLYSTADCLSDPLATGSAEEFAADGIEIEVADGSTTTVHGTATDSSGNTSACSIGSVTYRDTPGVIEPRSDTGVSSRAISPNGDGRKDRLRVQSTLSEPVDWSFVLKAPNGNVIASRSGIGDSRVVLHWGGRSAEGSKVADGRYTWKMTGVDEDDNPMDPDRGAVLVDRKRPVVRDLRISTNPFAPLMDRATRIRFGLSEPGRARVTVVGPGARVLLVAGIRTSGSGFIWVRWDGRDRRGQIASPGPYVVVIEAVDRAGNRTVHRGPRIKVR